MFLMFGLMWILHWGFVGEAFFDDCQRGFDAACPQCVSSTAERESSEAETDGSFRVGRAVRLSCQRLNPPSRLTFSGCLP